MEHNPQTVEILWTGGYDSTFRVVQLSQLDVEIQPYYLSDNRQSEPNELKAIEEITALLVNNPRTKCHFRPLIYIGAQDRAEDTEITAAYQRMLKQDFFGSQYDWLASFAKRHPGIELSVHQDDKAILLINKYGKLKKQNEDTPFETYILDTDSSSADLCTIFGSYHLPLAEYTKLQMKDYFVRNGYTDVMNKTWFCHRPYKGKPCGCCNPCNYTIEEGMKERFTPSGMLRHRLMKHKLIRKVNHKLQKLCKF